MSKEESTNQLKTALDDALVAIGGVLAGYTAELGIEDFGTISSVGRGIAWVTGLPNVESEELVTFPGNTLGMALNLDPGVVGVVLLDWSGHISAGQEVHRTGRVMDVPVGEGLLGRVVDAMGRPLDNSGAIRASGRRPIERKAPEIMDRAPVSVPLQTGLQVIDALVPVGRGQRELILGDRQTGKTAIALDTIINQKDTGVVCVYCAIGQESSTVVKVIADLQKYGAMDHTIVVLATGKDTPGLNFIAPYAATTMAEYFMEQGRDALVVYDDLTRHARSYRELSLLLRRPPAREAFPGDIFYVHSRLLERSTQLLKGGSLTALPIIETEEQDISAYIPTNLISITDGQIYLSPRLHEEAVLPAVDVGKSVSRVGGKAQLPAYQAIAGDLRLSYSQFEELEAFARFGTQLDEPTRKALERGRRVREVLKQTQFEPLPAPEQIAVLLAVTSGVFDPVPLGEIAGAKQSVRKAFSSGLPDLYRSIQSGGKLSDEDRTAALSTFKRSLERS